MTDGKTAVSKRRKPPKSSESSDELTALVPESRENDLIDRARSVELAVNGYPGIGGDK